MHRIFGIQEIVHEVITHVDQPTLRALATTATFLQAPVYARLYFSAKEGILHSLAKILLHRSEGSHDDNVMSRSQRCVNVAKFVRQVVIAEHTDSWNAVHTTLTLLRRPLYPFPHLRAIDVIADLPGLIDITDLLLCPSLKHLKLGLVIRDEHGESDWDGRLLAFLEGLPDKANGLSSVQFNLESDPYSHSDWSTGFECSFTNALGKACRHLPLVSLCADGIVITPNLLQDLASITSLESINLADDPYAHIQFNAKHFSNVSQTSTGFLSLRKAELCSGDLIGEILKSLRGAQLREISVTLLEWSSHVGVALEAVCLFSGTLEVLRLCGDKFPNWTNFQPHYQVPRQDFRHLASCSLMREFRFTFPYAESPVVELTNGVLEDLSKAWTMLEAVDIRYWRSVKADDVISLTLDCLIPFSLHCPYLRSIAIEPISPTMDVKLPPSILPSHPWKVLFVRYPRNLITLGYRHVGKIVNYLNALWIDVFLIINVESPFDRERADQISSRTTEIAANELLDHLRTARAMRPGSQWRLQHPGQPRLSDIYFKSFQGIADACPWEIIG